MSIICSNSDWNNSRCGCFGSLFGRIVFPQFLFKWLLLMGNSKPEFVVFHLHLYCFYRFFRID